MNCSTYDNCSADGCADVVSTNNANGQTCLCNEPEYGRGGNIDLYCASCHHTCATCSGEDIDDCLTCDEVVRTIEDAGAVPTRCLCNDGYFPDPDHETCTPCHADCLTCTGPDSW